VRQQEARVYDFFCVAPPGELGVFWLISTGSLHHHRHNLKRARRLAYVLIGYGTLVSIILHIMQWIDFYVYEPLPALGVYLFLMTLSVVLYFHSDFHQSVVLGALIGMITSTYVHNSAQARPAAAWIFITTQFGSYILMWIASLIFLPSLINALGMSGWSAEVATTLLRVGFFYTFREL